MVLFFFQLSDLAMPVSASGSAVSPMSDCEDEENDAEGYEDPTSTSASAAAVVVEELDDETTEKESATSRLPRRARKKDDDDYEVLNAARKSGPADTGEASHTRRQASR
jgi:hypothetical protein